LIFAAVGIGFLAGTATHWVLFWTDEISTEFPPMGGILLGLVVALCWTFPEVHEPRLFLFLAFLAGQVNAAFCRPLAVMNPFNAIPRNFVVAWGSAMIAFALSAALSLAAIRAVRRWRASRGDASLRLP
jgi:hypothetical protein